MPDRPPLAVRLADAADRLEPRDTMPHLVALLREAAAGSALDQLAAWCEQHEAFGGDEMDAFLRALEEAGARDPHATIDEAARNALTRLREVAL